MLNVNVRVNSKINYSSHYCTDNNTPDMVCGRQVGDGPYVTIDGSAAKLVWERTGKHSSLVA